MMEIKTDKRTRNGKSVIGEVDVRYSIEQETGQPVLRVVASINTNDERIGSVTIEKDGRVYVSFDYANSIPIASKKLILTTILTDVEAIFSEPVIA